MASGAKNKTTFAKLARESKLRERRLLKQERRAARKQAAAAGPTPLSDTSDRDTDLRSADRG
jgi:hypothetical protein